MTTQIIRTAQRQDFNGVMALYRELQPKDPVLDNGADRNAFHEILDSPRLHLFVVEDNATLVASTYLNIIPNITRGAASYAVIENVITLAALRGQGIGQRLMEHTLNFAWRQGCYKAMLQTGSSNPNTHHFYQACGFRDDEKTAYLARPPNVNA